MPNRRRHLDAVVPLSERDRYQGAFMDPFTHMELAKLRGRELQRQAERYNLSTALTPAFTPAETKLDLLRDRLAASRTAAADRWLRSGRPWRHHES
jgi:hypothetical protein